MPHSLLYFILFNNVSWRLFHISAYRDALFLKKIKGFRIYLFLFLAVLGLRCCTRASSSCGLWGSLCGGCSCCGAWVPGRSGCGSCRTWARVLWFPRLVAPWHVESSWTRDRMDVSCIAKRIVYPFPPEKPYSFLMLIDARNLKNSIV